jgi:uncharacterized protein with GYD domain
MPSYITLLRFTQKGVENIKESPARLETAKHGFKAMGAEIKAFYMVMGQYDAIVISEAPDDETIAKLALSLGSKGNVRTETLLAYTEEEYRKTIADLP